MSSANPVPDATIRGAVAAMPQPPAPQPPATDLRQTIGQDAADPGSAAQGPIPAPVSAAENPAPGPSTDTAVAALGRRVLSTAFVRVGPDGYLTVERHDGHVLVLRNMVLRARKYCGDQVSGGQYCGGYAEVAAARPGGAPGPAIRE